MKPKYFLLLLLTLLIVNSSLLIATVRYVSKTGTSTPPYTSWATAADSIQKAVNIADVGDTIYVANGIYNESIYVDKNINLWGSSADSTIINSAGTSEIYGIYFFENNSTMMNFKFISPGDNKLGIRTRGSNLKAENCTINVSNSPLRINYSSVNISKFMIRTNDWGIIDECPNDTCNSVYSNNIIFSSNSINTAVWFSFGGNPTFTNNVVVAEGNTQRGVASQYNSSINIKNNIVSGYQNTNIEAGQITTDSAYIENNISLNSPIAFGNSNPINNTIIRNNIARDVSRGVQSWNGITIPDYNLFWNVDQLVYGTAAVLGDSNIVADPMFVKDTIPMANGNYDFHLQKYSPAIDKGNPNILDKDGTRSDIGMYGGPFGETYTYQDLAPLAPRNFSAVLDSEYIRLKWNKNTEADTAFYRVYGDTITGFVIDSTKLIASLTDTFFVQSVPHKKSKVVYKITCVDKQGNESKPSIELIVNVTGIEDYPQLTTNYLLYQNYPNPFNPSTRIGYQLKERAYVKLMVYDIKGELIGVLVNKEQNAGYYEVEFNVGNGLPSVPNIQGLASGIYLYRIEIIGEGNIPVYTEMKKMLMIK